MRKLDIPIMPRRKSLGHWLPIIEASSYFSCSVVLIRSLITYRKIEAYMLSK